MHDKLYAICPLYLRPRLDWEGSVVHGRTYARRPILRRYYEEHSLVLEQQ